MIDFEITPNATIDFDIANGLDTAMLYVYDGTLVVTTNEGVEEVEKGHIILFDANSDDRRGIKLTRRTAVCKGVDSRSWCLQFEWIRDEANGDSVVASQ